VSFYARGARGNTGKLFEILEDIVSKCDVSEFDLQPKSPRNSWQPGSIVGFWPCIGDMAVSGDSGDNGRGLGSNDE
jgi:hypothetical protein